MLGVIMIKGFADKETDALYSGRPVRRFPHEICRRAIAKLQIIDNAADIGDCAMPPGNRLESLTGKREGQHSIRINDQWRVCFRWMAGDAYDVEIVDYH